MFLPITIFLTVDSNLKDNAKDALMGVFLCATLGGVWWVTLRCFSFKVHEPADGFSAGCGWLGTVWHLNLLLNDGSAPPSSEALKGQPLNAHHNLAFCF
jgi:hypothetical protein